MRLNEVRYEGAEPVDGYGPGFFRVSGKVYDGPILLSPDKVTAWGGFDDTAFVEGLRGKIDVLFVGTGAEIAHIPSAFRDTLDSVGIGVELMATPTACRTYNVLLGEGRRVGAILLPV
ncbi:MAG: Mth938-like domain-containing protein [Pseudomonadota bacterium]